VIEIRDGMRREEGRFDAAKAFDAFGKVVGLVGLVVAI